MIDKLKVGKELFASGKTEEAKPFFTDLLKEDSHNYEILNYLGVANFTLGDYNSAEDFFLQALAVKDDYKEAFINLVKLYHATERWEKTDIEIESFSAAMTFFVELEKKYPENPLFPYIIGFLMYERGKHGQAKDAFNNALKLKTDFYKAMYYLGLTNIALNLTFRNKR